jgi:hypothetical protein
VVVKNRGTDSKPWKWAIYSAGKKKPVVSSRENFGSMTGAFKGWQRGSEKVLGKAARLRLALGGFTPPVPARSIRGVLPRRRQGIDNLLDDLMGALASHRRAIPIPGRAPGV